jgi:RNA polymerase sigma-70 factor (ECF subfamily)
VERDRTSPPVSGSVPFTTTTKGLVSARGSADEASIRALVDEHFQYIWRLLRRFGLSRADADDATQQVFMVAARRANEIDEGRERTFLYGTALRVVANARRSERRRRETDDAELGEVPGGAGPPDQLLDDARARSRLDRLLGELAPELRRVLVLADIEGTTTREIAELEGIPAGTAASRLRRARAEFRALVAADRAKYPGEGAHR